MGLLLVLWSLFLCKVGVGSSDWMVDLSLLCVVLKSRDRQDQVRDTDTADPHSDQYSRTHLPRRAPWCRRAAP